MSATAQPRKARSRKLRATPRGKMRAYRSRMQAAGMRQVQIWVPDVRAPDVRREARRQSRLVSRNAAEDEALDLIEQVADLDEWK